MADNKRFQFTFYDSFFEAIKNIDNKEQQADFYNAICDYSLNGVEPSFKGMLRMAWELIKPNLEASRRKAEAGRNGGRSKQIESINEDDFSDEESKAEANLSKHEAEEKQIESKSKQTVSKIEIEREREREDKGEVEVEEKEEEKHKSVKKIPKKENYDLNFIPQEEVKHLVSRWLSYKKARKEDYKTQSSVELCVKNLLELSGGSLETAERIVDQSIANNWAGLFLLKKRTNQPLTAERYEDIVI